jgi:hypothetical protein
VTLGGLAGFQVGECDGGSGCGDRRRRGPRRSGGRDYGTFVAIGITPVV